MDGFHLLYPYMLHLGTDLGYLVPSGASISMGTIFCLTRNRPSSSLHASVLEYFVIFKVHVVCGTFFVQKAMLCKLNQNACTYSVIYVLSCVKFSGKSISYNFE